jgi:MFS family permease
VGYVGLAVARSPAVALAAAVAAGAGNGALQPAQSTLLAVLAPNEVRHRAGAVSRVAANFGLGLGAALGGLGAARGLRGFQTLFFGNAATYLVYVLLLVLVVRSEPRAPALSGGYRLVMRDRPFMHLALTNVAMIAVGWASSRGSSPRMRRPCSGSPPDGSACSCS